jgi:hypothetical protein
MRWRRGLLRSWVVLWVLVVCTGTYLSRLVIGFCQLASILSTPLTRR